MKALLLKGKEQLVEEKLITPIPKQEDLLVKVEITGIGGSEYLGYKNPGIRKLPNIMGHGICGTIEGDKRVAINPLIGCGQCEYCTQHLVQLCSDWQLIGVQMDGGFAQYVVAPKSSIVALPEKISWEQSCFIEPFANSVNAWEIAAVRSTEKVLVIGAGGLGLGVVACAKKQQHQEMYLLEKSDQRIAVAKEIGVKVATYKENSFDIVFDTVGSYETKQAAIKLMKRNGKSVFLGFAAPSQEINFSELIRMQYQFLGSFVYSKEQFLEAINLASYAKNEWVTNLSFDGVAPQLKAYLNDDFRVIKAALRPNRI